jgi:SAM-dependent methyltransferase
MNNQYILDVLSRRPALYEKSTDKFWDDEHISKGMMTAHLDPDTDLASRKPASIRQAVAWISGITGCQAHPRLLDLGCGPGLYDSLFYDAGFDVTGIDLSPRSLDYARAAAAERNRQIRYINEDYLTADFGIGYDTAIMIACDFGVLSPEDRRLLLSKVYSALKPGGIFVFDVHSAHFYESLTEYCKWSYSDGGFWSAAPYVNAESLYRYDAERHFVNQNLIIEEARIRCINIWNHGFTADELREDLRLAGFPETEFYSDVHGEAYKESGDVICAVARR